MKWLVKAIIVYVLCVVGAITVIQAVRPRASIEIDTGTVTIYYRNVNVNDVYKYIGKES